MNTNNKTWVDGLRIFENKQEWIVCDVKINADQMIKWINDNRWISTNI